MTRDRYSRGGKAQRGRVGRGEVVWLVGKRGGWGLLGMECGRDGGGRGVRDLW